ncbi:MULTISPECIES: outer membrane protein [unclassified Bradyrhizobium]|uniref:outer membrane protein n=1 Tax=unclassified Bradyrhizobium TaxID=2631580 RepID=UPI000360DA86|nr:MULTISPECIES: outer membrane beta-barrel protein [unclassified Bradyrhizobium]MBB4259764.1 outer membrane immunogenic protein [Bradyrhizobium sp. CIR3A]MBB4359707.1 outer membrane immunogenic protein [Bradyrhizobium sp. CIR18]MBB4392028.1 outer membrane immunogenic protein [Bradyrhizobium sp. ERR14]MBB4422595.1 outer membrane immunogenic protein [Bradyrhizobium sp. CIR48]NYG49426.1 outer membrane immunogenic protein [Bradyrhizobium sp. IAR9]
MKKNLLLAAVSLVALSATAPALAADLAARPYTKAPPAAIAAVYDWSGFYIGVNGGGGSADTSWNLVNFGAEGSHNSTGGTVGGQVGYRWQSGQFVFGLEGQGNWADFSGDNISGITGFRNRTRVDSFGLITGQVGYAWNNVLLYAKGGAAVVSNKYDVYSTVTGANLDRADETRWGATVGAGLEYGFAPNWTVGVEYNHIFLGDHDITFASGAVERVKQDVDMGLVRLNYKFGGPILGRY